MKGIFVKLFDINLENNLIKTVKGYIVVTRFGDIIVFRLYKDLNIKLAFLVFRKNL